MTDSSTFPEGEPGPGAGIAARRSGPLSLTLTMPADLTRLPVVRSLAATVGTDCDFDLDTIADLRMAVDEMTSILITRSVADGVINLAFEAHGDRVTVTGDTQTSTAEAMDEESFGWAVLAALVRDLAATVGADDQGGTSLRIALTVVTDRGGS